MKHRPEGGKTLAILRSAVENTNEAFVTIDDRQKVLFFNKAAEKMFGYSRADVVGRRLDVIMTPDCSQDHQRAIDRYIETRVPRRIGHGTELIATRKSGETFPAEISFSVFEMDGRPYFTGIVRDLTENKALREQVARAERLASLGQFVAEITHEINNPLMMIGGFARQLLRDNRDDEVRKKLDIIAEEVSRLENLLRELKRFYRPRPLTLAVFDVHELLQEVFDLVQHECISKDLNADLRTGKGPALIRGDREKLKQVFLNLIRNSIDALEAGGHLSLGSKRGEGRLTITVADDGCGIPEHEQGKVFSPFFSRKKHGTGLGLSICKRIIEGHAGSTFALESREGKGTTVRITIPLTTSHLTSDRPT